MDCIYSNPIFTNDILVKCTICNVEKDCNVHMLLECIIVIHQRGQLCQWMSDVGNPDYNLTYQRKIV